MGRQATQILQKGDDNGNGMIIKLTLRSGRDIYGFATRNSYGDDWDLGPTWNYLIKSDRALLLDTGARGRGRELLEMVEHVGVSAKSIDLILVSHGHEDHDGGLFEVSGVTGSDIVVNNVYERLIRIYPTKAPSSERKKFSASCWHCPMPKSVTDEHCLEYQAERSNLKVTEVTKSGFNLIEGVSIHHVPGHSPDSVVILVEEEVALVGDTVLPDITPHPTCEKDFEVVKNVLPPGYCDAKELFGLRAYIRSIKWLRTVGASPKGIIFLPGHRLFFGKLWGNLDLVRRVTELIEHHVQRCCDLLSIIEEKPKTAIEIAREYFERRLLRGFGLHLAIQEVLSHCELLSLSGDVVLDSAGRICATGETNFESLIEEIT
jgi:glyoxylase-like metal-dependent hydrolase (beta-lactamase superfamily II)